MKKTVTIRDAGLRRALEEALHEGAVKGLQVDLKELAEEHEINWSEDQAEAFPDQWESIGDLKGLEHATSLRELTVWGNSISSLAPLASLTELEDVCAFDNQIETTAGLANKPKLRELNLARNPIESIAELRGLPALEDLDLNEAKITDLSPLLDLPKLRKLDVWGVEAARSGKNLQVLVTLAQRKVALRMDPPLQAAVEQAQATVLAKEPSDDPVVERLRRAGQAALAMMWQQGGAAAKDGDWNTLLHRVIALDDAALAKQGEPDVLRIDLIKELARAGVDVNAQKEDYGRHTALSLAVAEKRSPAVIQALLDAGASARLPRLKPVLALAIGEGRPPAVIEQLIAAGADVTHPAVLAQAADKGLHEIVAPAARSVDWRRQVHSKTPALAYAVRSQHGPMIDLLLEAGAPAGAGRNYPAVFYVRDVTTLDKLIAHGADPRVRTTYGTALHNLRRSSPEAPALIDRLVELGVPIDARNFQGKTALFEVADDSSSIKAQALELARKLVAHGADPNARISTQMPSPRGGKAGTLRDRSNGTGEKIIRELGGVTTAVWARRQVKIVTGAKALEGDALDALTELALAGQLENLGADQARIEKQVAAMLKDRTDAVSKSLASLGLNPLTVLWLARGVQARDLFERGMLQIIAKRLGETEQDPAKTDVLLRALCDQGAPVDVTDATGDGALDTYLGRTNTYKVVPDAALVRALIPKSRKVITHAVRELLGGIQSPLSAEINAVLDILVEAGADLTDPPAFARLCRARRPDLVRQALEAGAYPAGDEDDSDTRALEQALEVDDIETVKILLDAGVPLDIGWEDTGPAFHEARSGEAYDLLLRYKLNPSLRSAGMYRRTLLDCAVERAVNLLSNWSGYAPALSNAAVRFVAHLVTSGWSLDTVDRDGKTPRSRLQAITNEHGRAAIAAAGLLG